MALAFAIASGLSPTVGLLTAVIGGFLISALGGSYVQIGGPTGAFIVIIYGIMTKYGSQGLIIATIMAGVMLLVIGFAKLGSIIKFIPFPVIIGFTSGIAVIILSSQINDFFGLGLSKLPSEFFAKWAVLLPSMVHLNWPTSILSLATVVVIVVLGKISKKIPAALVALVLGTIVVVIFGLPVDTIGSRFGAIAGKIPMPSLPAFDSNLLAILFMPALSIAMLGAIESLLSAVVADGMTGKKHDSNTELIGQGFANLVSGLFGGLPVTGAIARTATNVKSGGQTPVAGIIHAVFLLGVLLFLSPLTAYIPLASLAGILATVAYNMSEQHVFRLLLKGPRGDIVALLVTFLLTVMLDLTIAIPAGIFLSLIVFVAKMSSGAKVTLHTGRFSDLSPEVDPFGLAALIIPDGVEVLTIDGPLFFGAAEAIKEELSRGHHRSKVLIIGFRAVPSIDASGAMVMRTLLAKAQSDKRPIIISGLQKNVKDVFDKIGLSRELGAGMMQANMVLAIAKSNELLGIGNFSLVEKLKRGSFLTDLSFESVPQVIKALVDALPLSTEQKEVLVQSVIERENMASTALVPMIAYPHPHQQRLNSGVDDFVALAILKESTSNWDKLDHKVKLVVLMVSKSSQDHLLTFSGLASLLNRAEFVDKLLLQTSKEQVIMLFER